MVVKNIVDYVFNLKRLAFLFISILFLWIGHHLYYLYFFNAYSDGFKLGDWLVNYQDGGFKRRGLSGSLFFLLQDITGLRLIVLVYCGQMLLYFTFFMMVFKIMIKKQVTLLYLTLLISPLTFMVYFNHTNFIARKDIIIFNIFALYIYLINKNKLTAFKEYLICALLVIATLFHEITVFYVPYFILAHFLIYKKLDVKKYLLFFLSCFIPALLIFVFGAKTNEGESLSILASRGVILTPHSIFSFSNGLLQDIYKIRNNPLGYGLYLVSLVLGLLHFGYYIKKGTDFKYKKVILYFVLIIAYSVPIFVLANDWGRWLHIHFVLLCLILTYKLGTIGNEGIWKSSSLILNRENFIYLLFVPFLFLWQVWDYDLGFYIRGIRRVYDLTPFLPFL